MDYNRLLFPRIFPFGRYCYNSKDGDEHLNRQLLRRIPNKYKMLVLIFSETSRMNVNVGDLESTSKSRREKDK